MVNMDGQKFTWILTTPVKFSVSKPVVFYNFHDSHARWRRTSQNDLAKKLEKHSSENNMSLGEDMQAEYMFKKKA